MQAPTAPMPQAAPGPMAGPMATPAPPVAAAPQSDGPEPKKAKTLDLIPEAEFLKTHKGDAKVTVTVDEANETFGLTLGQQINVAVPYAAKVSLLFAKRRLRASWQPRATLFTLAGVSPNQGLRTEEDHRGENWPRRQQAETCRSQRHAHQQQDSCPLQH